MDSFLLIGFQVNPLWFLLRNLPKTPNDLVPFVRDSSDGSAVAVLEKMVAMFIGKTKQVGSLSRREWSGILHSDRGIKTN